MIATGRLFGFMDSLAEASRQSVALFGMLGTQLQIFRCTSGIETGSMELTCGAMCPLSSSAAGLLLLSTVGAEQSEKMLWRLNAESGFERKFSLPEAKNEVVRMRQSGHATDKCGFVPKAQVSAVLVPPSSTFHPLALGVVYDPNTAIDPDALVETLQFGIGQCLTIEVDSVSVAARDMQAGGSSTAQRYTKV